MNESTQDYTSTGLEIAVIGMSGRFPGAKNLKEFWRNLQNGVESIVSVTDEELEKCGIGADLLDNPHYIKAGAFLEDIEYFDASFFDYAPEEVEIMDPQTRIFHECVWEALEDAGYDPKRYEDSIGLYAGAAPNLYWETLSLLTQDVPLEYFSTAIYNDKDFLSSHISYKLNLQGPSFTVSTACSTSLVAIHLACQGLLGGECNIAIAGGIAVFLPKRQGYLYHERSILSPDGHCRTFDATAQGTVFGNGAGVVVLKPLEEALADGDHIWAVIKSSAINNDGHRKVGYTAPSVKGQAMVIRAAQRAAEVEAESISYVETHGTGTPLGDPIEFEALKLAFDTDKKGFCRLGSLKPNIGHLYSAAGIASFIKTVLALHYKQIPPSINFETPNPQIDFDNSPFCMNTQLVDWENGTSPLRAGVSSFGIGGTNAHVILEKTPEKSPSEQRERACKLLLLSAKTETALDTISDNLATYLKNNPDTNLADIAYTLQVGRAFFPYRRMVLCSSINEAITALSRKKENILPGQPVGYMGTVCNNDVRPAVVFMFNGQGAQYIKMGLELSQNEQIFQKELDRCFRILDPLVDYDLRGILAPNASQALYAEEQFEQLALVQPLIFAFEYALAKLFMYCGIHPAAMIGYRSGEYVAGCLSGALSLEDAAKLIAMRVKLINRAPSREMKSIVEEFEEQIKQVTFQEPQIPYISCTTGTWVTREQVTDHNYWMSHPDDPREFRAGIERIVAEIPHAIFVEIGSGNDLGKIVGSLIKEDPLQQVFSTIRSSSCPVLDEGFLFQQLGSLWGAGVDIDWEKLYTHETRQRISLPTYPFERQYYWVNGTIQKRMNELWEVVIRLEK